MSDNRKKTLVFVGIGFELVGLILAGLMLGQHLDKTYDLNGLSTAGISLIVLAGWLVHLVYLIKQFQKNETD